MTRRTQPSITFCPVLWQLARLGVGVALLLTIAFFAGGIAVAEENSLALYVDAGTGQDTPSCGTTSAPCKTLQQAITLVPNEGSATIYVAAGVYAYGNDDNPCYQHFGHLRAVACIVNRQITLRGGFASGNWAEYNPTLNLTAIDGQNQTRGIYVASVGPAAGLDISGFTLRNGRHVGANSNDLGQSSAFGGALLLDQATLAMTDLVFEGNMARGGASSNAAGGIAHGGAVAIRRHPGVVQISNVIFRDNRAEGGAGLTQGGYANGGALYLLEAKAELQNVQFFNNVAASGSRQRGDAIAAPFGGAMVVQGSAAKLTDVLFDGNRAEAGSTGAPAGDPAAGGALAVRDTATLAAPDRVVTLTNIIFRNNRATGGDGAVRGGFALGGALFTYKSVIDGVALEFTANTVQAGSTAGPGRYATETGDAVGGAAAFQVGSTVNLRGLTAFENQAFGGVAREEAGGAFGGAFMAEGMPWYADAVTTVSIADGDFQRNRVTGAAGNTGGLAQGGAIETLHASLTLVNSRILENYAQGGDGSTLQGAAGGGGLTLGNIANSAGTATLTNNIIANNEVKSGAGPIAGGGGGGIWLQNINAVLTHNTIARNRLLSSPLQGAALIALNDGASGTATSCVVTMNYNLVAEHDVDPIGNGDGNAAIFVKASSVPGWPANRVDLGYNLFASNTQNYNTFRVGIFNGVDTSILSDNAGFVGSGTPWERFRILFSSPAVDAATGSSSSLDIADGPRIGIPDAGAWEALPFIVLAYPIGDRALRVHWGNNPSVQSYDLTINCPTGAATPNEIDCGANRSYPSASTGLTLTGLTNNVPYEIAVTPVLSNQSSFPPTRLIGTATDLMLHLPLVTK